MALAPNRWPQAWWLPTPLDCCESCTAAAGVLRARMSANSRADARWTGTSWASRARISPSLASTSGSTGRGARWSSRPCVCATRRAAPSSSWRMWRTSARCLASGGLCLMHWGFGASPSGGVQFRLPMPGPGSGVPGGGFEQRPDALPDDLLPPLSGQRRVNFNGGRPPPGRWLLPREEHPRVCERLSMLGNAVVPLQAHLAARLLQFEWRWALACLRCRKWRWALAFIIAHVAATPENVRTRSITVCLCARVCGGLRACMRVSVRVCPCSAGP